MCIGTATLNGAIESGVRAAEAVLSGTDTERALG